MVFSFFFLARPAGFYIFPKVLVFSRFWARGRFGVPRFAMAGFVGVFFACIPYRWGGDCEIIIVGILNGWMGFANMVYTLHTLTIPIV